jgi:hypothetical protein
VAPSGTAVACSGTAAAAASAHHPGSSSDGDDAPDWMLDFGARQEREHQQQLRERQRRRIERAKARLARGGAGGSKAAAGGRRQRSSRPAKGVADDPESEFLVDDWHSDCEDLAAVGGAGSGARKRSPRTAGLGLDSSGGGSSSGSEGESGADGHGGRLGEDEDLEVPRKRQASVQASPASSRRCGKGRGGCEQRLKWLGWGGCLFVSCAVPPACEHAHTPAARHACPAYLACLACPAYPACPPCPQVIFASRTHSQLSQFVGELHRTPFADELSLVALGSRKVSGRYSPAIQNDGTAAVPWQCVQGGGSCAALLENCPWVAQGCHQVGWVSQLWQ